MEYRPDLYQFRVDGNQYASTGLLVGEEPRNALLIFASDSSVLHLNPFSQGIAGTDIQVMTPGAINNMDWGSKSAVYFPPGVYWMNQTQKGAYAPYGGASHIVLAPNTYWVHLALGAYLKSAIEYTTTRDRVYATGPGVLSGEQYAYQANVELQYECVKNDTSSVHMWWNRVATSSGTRPRQQWRLLGPTLANPPFNSEDMSTMPSIVATDYKQVGAWFDQTDGLEMYDNSAVSDVFYHSNDDTVKLYHTNITVDNVVIWKGFNDAVVQMGWNPYQMRNATVRDLDLIHSRYRPSQFPTALVGASAPYDSQKPTGSFATDVRFVQMRCEGVCPALMQLYYPKPFVNVSFVNVTIDKYIDTDLSESTIYRRSSRDWPKITDMTLENFEVGGTSIDWWNFQSNRRGKLNIPARYWGHWRIYTPKNSLNMRP